MFQGGNIAVRVALLASGSSGNCTFIATERTKILIDAGLSGRETQRRLAGIGEKPESIQAILITHEHWDHIAGLARLAKKYRIPVYITSLTRNALPHDIQLPALETIQAGHRFQIADLAIDSFGIPHDAVDPIAFRVKAEGVQVAVCTDLGYIPQNVKDSLRGTHCLIVESNHDLEMLRNGPYPWTIKQRIMSRVGHLSNAALNEFLTSDDFDREARVIVLAHLSEQNNHPEIARMAASQSLESKTSTATRIAVGSQKEPTEVFSF